MQDTELFLSLAEIAGVFVGFGALIAVRSGGAGEPQEVAPMRLVVGLGMLTVIGAIAPVTLGRYDLTQPPGLGAEQRPARRLLRWALVHPGPRTRVQGGHDHREVGEADHPERTRECGRAAHLGASGLALVAIVLGVAPELEAALYYTVVVLLLVMAAWTLLWLVFMHRRPQAASDPAELPATGGLNA